MRRMLLNMGAAIALGVGCVGNVSAPEGVPDRAGSSDSSAANPLAGEEAFVPIPRTPDDAELASRRRALHALGSTTQELARGPSDFYLAIRKSALSKKWFVSAFLKTVTETTGLTTEGAYSLGTDVVSFRVQNGRLFVARNETGQTWSDAFDPSIIIDVYPIVTGVSSFERLGGAGDYVLVNPAAGLNNVALTSDTTTADFGQEPGSRLDVDVAYVERFTRIDDGIAFDVVTTGTLDRLDPDSLETINPTLALTTTMSFREYREGDGYEPTEPPEVEHYFLAPRRVVKDQAVVQASAAAKWNFHPGMRPVEWLITRNAPALGAQHDFPLVEMVTRGIESWNAVFGFRVFKARLARPDEEVGRDDRNFMIIDSDERAGAAFAQTRTNPNTGETRGASVYFPAAFFATNPYEEEAPTVAPVAGDDRLPPRVRWNGLRAAETNCSLPVQRPPRPYGRAPGADTKQTADEKLALYVQEVVAHEVGHTLGLRHNFKGSLVPPSSSVMDYANDADSVAAPVPQAYDIAAIRYLYGLSAELPTQPFCTDEGVPVDPECAVFDSGADPLVDTWAPSHANLVADVTAAGTLDELSRELDYYGTPILSYVRAGASAKANQAWDLLTAAVAAPLAEDKRADPAYAAASDALMRYWFTRLYADATDVRTGEFWTSSPSGDPVDGLLLPRITDQLALHLENVDGVRSFETRRLAVDVLRHLQTAEAYERLSAARESLGEALANGTLTGDESALTEDLLARIDVALSPYFD